MSEKKYMHTEKFRSFQGEGKYTGIHTMWVRFFLCNLQCRGFMQENPADPSTYVTPESELIDLTDITSYNDLPVFKYGCDSAYSVAKRFKHLTMNNTADEIASSLVELLKHPSNPNGLFIHPITGQETHMAFTGGEPMLQQDGIIDIMSSFEKMNNLPRNVTVETNGTRPITDTLANYIDKFNQTRHGTGANEWFWSISPKLLSTSGEQPKKAIKPEVIRDYFEASPFGQLKYVVNGSDASWKELENCNKQLSDLGVNLKTYVMPVGATKEQQEEPRIAEIAMEAMHRGYYFSGRVHATVFGNIPNT